jgi:hypothetical protein
VSALTALDEWLLTELEAGERTVDELYTRSSTLRPRPARPDLASALDKMRIQGHTKASPFIDGACRRVWSKA